jgi:hypothetical protein
MPKKKENKIIVKRGGKFYRKSLLEGISEPVFNNRLGAVSQDIGAVTESLSQLSEELVSVDSSTRQTINKIQSEITKLGVLVDDKLKFATKDVGLKLLKEIKQVDASVLDTDTRFKQDVGRIDSIIASSVAELRASIDALPRPKDWQDSIDDLDKKIAKVRTDLLSAISTKIGGGNANRNILVASNPSVLGRYTDLNLIPGSNVTLSYTNNDNLKTTDLTIAATGGGGAARSISTVSVSSVIGALASTDYVIIASAGIELTMPTAVSNTNLYTIKNTSASSVLLTPDGSETIDTQSDLILATQYTAVDLISDNANWQIT